VDHGLRWLSQGMTDVPADDSWLAPREAAYLARMRFPKRASEFRLGRWTAKRALALYLGRPDSAELRGIVIDRAPDGAPAPFVDGRPAQASITMTDRADQAVVLVGPPELTLGCDLELVEPRSAAFVADYLTAGEQQRVAAAGAGERDLWANLVWCGKESALKVLRTGLRRSTLGVEVSFPDAPDVDGWLPLEVRSVEGTLFSGWWQRFSAFVLTLAASAPFAPPRAFVEPPGLASAVPGEQWRTRSGGER
jgi:4'-phosphopantetheinyl transferase